MFDNPLPVTDRHGFGDDNDHREECSDTIRPGGGNDFVDGNGPDVAGLNCFQDDILAEGRSTLRLRIFGSHCGDSPRVIWRCLVAGPVVINRMVR